MNIRSLLLILVLFLTTSAYCLEDRIPASTTKAQPSIGDSEPPPPRLFGWEETHNRWHTNGYDFNVTYKLEYVAGFGGLKNGAGFLGNLDLTLDIDLGKIFGANGFSFFVYGLGDHGINPTDFVGDSFATSNLQSPDTFKIYEFYLKYTHDEKFVSILGFRDLNADFYSTESAKNLLNSSFGISAALAQTGDNGPSIFPTTSLAASIFYDVQSAYAGAAVFNAIAGNPDNPYGTHMNFNFNQGELQIAEIGIRPEVSSLKTKLSLGGWQYTKAIARLDSAYDQKNSGAYAMADLVWDETFSLFARFGNAKESLNKFGQASEYGLKIKGPFSARPNDSFNVGLATLNASKDYKTLTSSADHEHAYEINYQFVLDRGIKITPDYQYILNPDLSASGTHSEVYSLRFEFSL